MDCHICKKDYTTNKEANECERKHGVSAPFSDGLLVCDVVDEFAGSIPEHISAMPAFSSNGVTRNEMEWKSLTFAMAGEIIRLRKEN